MASLYKEAKRGRDLPRIIGGSVMTCQRYAERPDEEKSLKGMPPLMYCAVVTKRGTGNDSVEYSLQLTEEEMIAVTSEWLTMANRRRIDAATELRKKAERAARETEACPSKTSQPSSA